MRDGGGGDINATWDAPQHSSHGCTGTRRDANSQPQPRGCRTARGRGGGRLPTTARSWKSPHRSLQGYKQWGESRRLCSCRREELTEAAGGGTSPSSAPLPCSLGGGQGGAPQYIQEEGPALPVHGQEQGLRSVQNQSTCVPLPWHRAGAEGTTLGGEAAPLQPPLPQPPREGLAHPPFPSSSSSSPSSSPCPQNGAASWMAPLGAAAALPLPANGSRGGRDSHGTSRPPPTCR